MVFEKQHISVQWLASSDEMVGPNLDWIRLSKKDHDTLLFSVAATDFMGSPNKDEVRDLALTLFPDIELPPPQRPVFNFHSNRRMITVYVATVSLSIGAIVDTFAINHASLALVPFMDLFTKNEVKLAIPLGIVSLSIALYVFFRKDKMRQTTKAANALVIALWLFAIAMPWAKRVDHGLTSSPVVEHSYKVDALGDLKPWPADDTLPTLLAKDVRQPRGALPTGTEIVVELTHGALGLWQVVTTSPARMQRDRGDDSSNASSFPWDLLFLPLLPIGLLIPWLLQKKVNLAKQVQDRLVERVKGENFRRVELARPNFLQRRFNLIPYEALGILVDETTQIRLLGQWPNQSAPFDVRVDKADVKFLKISDLWTNSPARVRVEVATPQGAVSFAPDQSLANRHANGMAKKRSNDLIRSVFPGRFEEAAQHWPFALESSSMAMGVIILALALGAWAAIDTYALNPFALAIDLQSLLPIYPILWVPALTLASGAMPWVFGMLRRHRVPAKESAALAIMLGASILSASIPVAKRADRHLATGEGRTYNYVRTGSGVFKPRRSDARLPNLPGVRIHRDAPPPESDFEITLIKGWLGLWQYDQVQLMRSVYCKSSSENDCSSK